MRARRRVAKPRAQRLGSAVVRPRREARVQPGRAGLVRVHVRRDREALAPGALDPLDRAVELRPVAPAGLLQVIDLGADARAPRDLDELVDRLEQAPALAAQMR